MSDTIRPVEDTSGAIVGFVRSPPGADVPVIRTVADAEALFGRGAAVIHARGGVAEHLAADAPPVVGVPTPLYLTDSRSPRPAENERYVSRVTGEEHRVLTVRDDHAYLIDASNCARRWSFDAIARDLVRCDPTTPKVTATLAAENAALREALAASGELLAEAHAEIDRLRGAK